MHRSFRNRPGRPRILLHETVQEKTLETVWDIPGVKKEVVRLVMRCHKRISKAQERVTRLEGTDDQQEAQVELAAVQERLEKLNSLEEELQSFQGPKKSVLPADLCQLALDLEVSDAPPVRPPRGPPRKKNRESVAPRLPYKTYYSQGTEIRVGRRATDNDVVSTDPEHRSFWWMHAAGCPGSHVIICDTSEPTGDLCKDAAALAVHYSKANNQKSPKVTLTPCQNIRKPPGSKPGLVQISSGATTRTVKMQLGDVGERVKRLEAEQSD